ncbi:PLC-like phosphodiesterase [Kalaharituber pfeilii]|nr:PLC-like phosphodiesterase [Kalaharituber pfeilii]
MSGPEMVCDPLSTSMISTPGTESSSACSTLREPKRSRASSFSLPWQISAGLSSTIPTIKEPALLAPDPTRKHHTAPQLTSITLPASAVTTASEGGIPTGGSRAGLMRRLSQTAANKLRKRNSSNKGQNESSGPVTMRHRSDSGSVKDLGLQYHSRSDDEDDYSVHEVDGPYDSSSTKNLSAPAAPSPPATVVIPEILQKGTILTRVTQKKTSNRTFKLDVQSAKVTWDPSKPSSRFFVDDVKEIRVGADARNYREEFKVAESREDLWFTIIYAEHEENGKLKALHLIAPDNESFVLWTTTLEKVLKYRTEFMSGLAVQGDKFVSEHWRNEFASRPNEKEERLSFDRVERLCRRLHVNCSRRFLRKKFNEADREGTGYLDFAQFQKFVSLLKERAEIIEIWRNIVKDAGRGMTREEFWLFLRDIQQVDVEADAIHIDRVFRKFCRKSRRIERMNGIPSPLEPKDAESRMSMDAFQVFLRSQAFNPPLQTTVTEQDLEQPLNEYFISSSHNTYLLGRQVVGESSIEAYIKVLQRGCRCVEVDCWDGDDGRPVVYHGRTFTTKVLFADVIVAIGKYAFLASRTLTLKDHLVVEPIVSHSTILPSPKDLKHKILIKVKSSEIQDIGAALEEFEAIKEANARQENAPRVTATVSGSATGSSESTSDSLDSDCHGSPPGEAKVNKPKRKPKKIAPALGQLGIYIRGQKFSNFALPESKTYNHVFSFAERTAMKFSKDPDKKIALEKHNVRYLMRVYPSGYRVNSSNFDPNTFWRRGVQMVALNWQTYDLGLQMNEAMFASLHDHTGYVLKPKELRNMKTTNDPMADAAAAKIRKDKMLVKFSIDVISAQQLPRPKDQKPDESFDPFVEVEVFSADDKAKGASTVEGGVEAGDSKAASGLGAPTRRRTVVVRENGFSPIFSRSGSGKMSFSIQTKFPSLVFVRFALYNDSNSGDRSSMFGSYTAKLISLQQGYRHLPLYDNQGEQFLFSTLFVRVQVDPIQPLDIEPEKSTTMEHIRSGVKSVLGNRFSSGR